MYDDLDPMEELERYLCKLSRIKGNQKIADNLYSQMKDLPMFEQLVILNRLAQIYEIEIKKRIERREMGIIMRIRYWSWEHVYERD